MTAKRINIDELIDVLMEMRRDFTHADVRVRESDNTLLLAGSSYKEGDEDKEDDDETTNLDDLNNYIA